MKKKAIIHLSDLHVALHQDLNDIDIKGQLKTLLNSDMKDEKCNAFIEELCSFIKKNYDGFELSLVITGDIANISEAQEYNTAIVYLRKIIEKLGIGLERVLLIPGDHDVNRELNKLAHRSGKDNQPDKKSFEYQQEKLANFSAFYKSFVGADFSYDTAITNILEFKDEKLLLVGLNSTHKIDYQGGLGAIDIDKLGAELAEIDEKYSEHSKIVAVHHNMFSGFENSATGQWEVVNRVAVLSLLLQHKYKLIINGNEHTRGSGINPSEQIYYSDSGAISSKEPPASFKVYPIQVDETSLSLGMHLYVIQNANKVSVDLPFGSWSLIRNGDAKEINEIPLVQRLELPLTENNVLDSTISQQILEPVPGPVPEPLTEKEAVTEIEEEPLIKYENQFYQQELFKIVKEKKLFHSGHFHWSESSRAHNWIDISNILNHMEHLSLAKNSILDVIDNCKLNDQFDFIIGLGIEGTILSTRASVKYNKPFSFLPYSYRYDEHSPYEKQLNFENNGEYKTVLIITDVVHDGRTLRKLINKREPEFFKAVERILVISLFYTGDNDTDNPRILNSDKIQNFDLFTDHKETRIEYYYILALKVEECPYGADFRTQCLIVKEGLGCVHHFYDEGKALEKLANE